MIFYYKYLVVIWEIITFVFANKCFIHFILLKLNIKPLIGGFNMQMHTPAKLKNIFVKTLKRGTKI